MGGIVTAAETAYVWDPNIFPKDGISLSYVQDFYSQCGGRDRLVGLTTTEVCQSFVMPQTAAYGCSYCEWLRMQGNPAVGKATVFISHAWRYMFLDVVNALLFHFRNNLEVVVWFDLFSNNQHKATQLPYEWWSTTFLTAIKDFGHTVMVMSPWNNPIPYRRAWCIYEAYSTIVCNGKFEIAMSETDRFQFLKDVESDPRGEINRMLTLIDARNSEAFKAEDREHIFHTIESTVGFGKINAMVFEQLRGWVISVAADALNAACETERSSKLTVLGKLHELQGKYNEAEVFFVECLQRCKNQLRPSHPDTLHAMNNLAGLFLKKGKYDQAEPLYEDCLDLREDELGETHPDTLISMNNLSILYSKQGKYEDAESIGEECLRLRRENLGESHNDTLYSMNNLAVLYKKQGKFEQAEQLYKESYRLRREQVGEKHPDTLSSINNLAQFYSAQKKFDEAEPLFLECLKLRKEKLGPAHPETLSSMSNLGNFYLNQGKLEIAEPLCVEYLHLAKKHHEDKHPDTLDAMYNVALLRFKQKKYVEAEMVFALCCPIFVESRCRSS